MAVIYIAGPKYVLPMAESEFLLLQKNEAKLKANGRQYYFDGVNYRMSLFTLPDPTRNKAYKYADKVREMQRKDFPLFMGVCRVKIPID